jgi:Fe-S cluster biogenesis protein NfuA/nitrite reductase/ring-hydroxylating ferredoxin subunit
MIAQPSFPKTAPPASPPPPGPPDNLNERARRIQKLIEQIDALHDAEARSTVHELLRAVMELNGVGVSRILEIASRDSASGVRDEILKDGVTRSLLLIHDLHPHTLEERLNEALAKVLPYIHSHGGDVTLVDLVDGQARFRLQGTCKGCASSAITMDLAVRAAIEEFCPDLVGFEVEGAPEAAHEGAAGESPGWSDLGPASDFGDGLLRTRAIKGVPLVVGGAKGELFAFRNVCPVCGAGFDFGWIDEDGLACPTGHRFDPGRAGAGRESVHPSLSPFPLLVEGGRVRVSVRGPAPSP